MSRAVVYDAIMADSSLATMVPQENVMVNPKLDGRPDGISPAGILIIKWEEQEVASVFFEQMAKGPRVLTVWAHYPEERSDDYGRLDSILYRVKQILCALEDTDAGGDGYAVVNVSYQGDSADLKDPGLKTICKYATFKVLSRKV